MVAVFLADGFEEIEALAVVDVLRRAELTVVTVGIGGRTVCGAHGIPVGADMDEAAWEKQDMDALQAVVLPGGHAGHPPSGAVAGGGLRAGNGPAAGRLCLCYLRRPLYPGP